MGSTDFFPIMSSAAYNLSRKFEWMARRLRKIDDVAEIKDWIATMSAINRLLKEFEFKEYRDTWKPWKKKGMKQMEIEYECTKNDVPVKPQEKNFRPETRAEIGGGDATLNQMQQFKMPMLRSPVSLISESPRGLWMSHQGEMRGKKRGIKDLNTVEMNTPESQTEVVDEKVLLIEKKVGTDFEALDGDTKKIIKDGYIFPGGKEIVRVLKLLGITQNKSLT